MPPYTLSPLDGLVLFLGLAIALYLNLSQRNRAPKPPGPKGYPVIGNMLDMPSSFEWKTFAKWADLYGDFMSVSVFGTTIIIVSSYKRAAEIFDHAQKNTVYSSRPYLAFTGELIGFGQTMALLPYSPESRNARKFFQKELGSKSRVQNFYPQEEQLAVSFIRGVLDTPDDLVEHIYHHSAAITLRVAYGYETQEKGDKILQTGNQAMDGFTKSLEPGKFLANLIPILRYIPGWVPGAGFQKVASDIRKLYDEMVQVPFQFTKTQLAAGTAEESFVSKWLQTNMSPQDQEELMHTAGAMFGAGGETTAITVHYFFMILAQYPEIQARAKVEVDSVVGRDRLPTFEDRDQMPYLEALIKEVMRCHPVIPLGLPHATIEDDLHDGYFIPKDSIVFTNIWQMCRDPEVYKQPEEFNPDRFLGESPELDPALLIFGFGRRICPGRILADASMFITEAMTLWSFDVSCVEVDGKLSPPVYASKPGAIGHLEPFKINITPRTNKLRDLVSRPSN